MSSSGSQQLALRPGPDGLRGGFMVAGLKIHSLEDAKTHIRSLPPGLTRNQGVRDLATAASSLQESLDDFIVASYDNLVDGSTLGYTEEERGLYEELIKPLRQVSEFSRQRQSNAQDQRNAEAKYLELIQSMGQRGNSFRDYLQETGSRARHFYNNLQKFTKDKQMRQVILILNHRLYIRIKAQKGTSNIKALNRRLTVPDTYSIETLDPAVLFEKKDWKYDVAELAELGLTFHACGMLIEGEQGADMSFAEFTDETDNHPAVILEQLAEPEDPYGLVVDPEYSTRRMVEGMEAAAYAKDPEIDINSPNSQGSGASSPLSDPPEEIEPPSHIVPPITTPATPNRTPLPTSLPTSEYNLRTPAKRLDTSGKESTASPYKGAVASTKRKHTTTKVIEIPACQCTMADGWKLLITERGWANASFKEIKSVLEFFAERATKDPNVYLPCGECMDRLSRRSMVVPNGTDEDQARRYVRIFNVLQEERGSPPRTAASWVRAWIEPSLQMLFLKTPVILAEREKRHTANKFVGQTLPTTTSTTALSRNMYCVPRQLPPCDLLLYASCPTIYTRC